MQIADNLKERIVWLSLVALTMLSWWLSEARGEHTGYDIEMVTTAVMLVGFFKVRLVGMHFMELRLAPWPLRLAFEAWIVIACAAILIVYWQAPAT
jgi:hypothetical protein